MDSEVGPVDGDERLADIAQCGFAVESQLLFGQHDAGRPAISLADRVDADGIVVKSPLRLLGRLDFGDQPARRRIPPGKLDAGCLADQAAAAIAPDEVLRAQRLAVGERDVDAGVVLRETRDFTSAIHRHRQLADPLGEDALDVVLQQPEDVVVSRGKVADVQRHQVEVHDRKPLSLRDEPIGDSALIEDLDGA